MIQQGQDNEVMTLGDVSRYLHLAEKTVLRMAQRGEIPAAKVASQWRFLRSVVREWLAGQMQGIPSSTWDSLAFPGSKTLPLHEVIRDDLMSLNLSPGPKDHVLSQLLGPLKKTGFISHPERLLKSLIERERMMTTAVGHGIAIPHPRRPLDDMFPEPAIALGVCKQGTDFMAIDDQPVYLFFLICATSESIHLELMAKVAWLSRQTETLRELIGSSSRNKIKTVLMDIQDPRESRSERVQNTEKPASQGSD
jgi:PTS system nitrogen regulatory IIA component